MTGNLIIISLIGLIAGILLSIPAGGPTSIVILTNALRGRTRYCNLVNTGAGIADVVYIFISVFGLTKLLSFYTPYIPYVLIIGCLFICFVSIKVSRNKIELDHLNESEIIKENVDEGHGFLTGILLGFLNPNLFLSWMSTSLIIFSSLASFGFDTGGLDKNVSQQLIEIQHDIPSDTNTNHLLTEKNISKTATELHYSMPDSYPFLLCIFYALFAALGSMSWFYYLTWLIVKYRNKISESTIQRAVRILSVFLFVCGLFLGYKGINMLIDT